jgi:predicted AlkP superfamily pyrophosphatase or phosphodiesterase
VRAAIESALTPLLGEGPHVTTVSGANVYLTPGTLSRIVQTRGAREAVTLALAKVPGLGAVYWTDELAARTATEDAGLQLARNSWVAGRSGDLMVMYDQFWIGQSTGTTHGSPYDYDRRVPVWFAGPGIVPGERWTAASPTDIAPTLAQMAGVTLARTDGRVLGEIFR